MSNIINGVDEDKLVEIINTLKACRKRYIKAAVFEPCCSHVVSIAPSRINL